MSGIFISYRRSDSGGWAGRLNDHLSLRFGSNSVLQDVDDLRAGRDYLPQLLQQIKSADVILIVIGPHWLKDGLKRLRDPKDVLRMEIVHALKKKNGVIPTLVGGATMPNQAQLPRAVSGLVKRHGIELVDALWRRSMQALFEQVQEIMRKRSSRGPKPLPELHKLLDGMQNRYFELMPQPEQALAVAREALHLLDQQMPCYPYDHYLQMFRGFFLKNEAMSLRDLGDQQGSAAALQKAGQVFQIIEGEAETYLANAYTGVGGVRVLNGENKEGLRYFDRALELVPNHPYAQHDREETLRFLKSKEKHHGRGAS